MVGVFGVLLLTHLLGDFPCQPYPLIRWKIASLRGLLAHVAIQVALTLPVLIWFVPAWGWWALLLACSHFLIDWLKVRLTRAGWVELAAFFLDQAAHLTVLWVIVRASGAAATFSGATADVLRLTIILVLAIYAGAVVVFLAGAALKRPDGGFAPIPSPERWRGTVERTALVLGVLLLPSVIWIVLAAGYALAAATLQRDGQARVKQIISVAWALAVTLIVGQAGV